MIIPPEQRDTAATRDTAQDTARDTARATSTASTAVPLSTDPPVRPAPWHAAAIAGAMSLVVAVIATWLWRRMRARRADTPTG